MSRGPPRPPGSVRKEVWLSPSQKNLLDALVATSPRGRPTLTSLLMDAIDGYIQRELAKPGVQAEIEDYLKERRKVVNLRDVSQF